MSLFSKLNTKVEFEKVSKDQYIKDWCRLYGSDSQDKTVIGKIWDDIKLPQPSTFEAAGFDFFIPFSVDLVKGDSIVIPTGIRCKMKKNTCLLFLPRSSSGFNYHLTIANTVPLIDGDYYYTDNEGHIMIKLIFGGFENAPLIALAHERDSDAFLHVAKDMTTPRELVMNKGDKFVQGLATKYYHSKSTDKSKVKVRKGGIGSTGK